MPGLEDFYQANKDNPDFMTMTVLAEVQKTEDLDEWADFGATYTVLWDTDDTITQAYDVVDRPMFMVIGRDMTILFRRSNAGGLAQAEELVETLLSAE
ncbi:MAG: hypothetical protein P8R54_04830 [Myxococcota bacterium]|nr:hypothetical protein [Myxococcota bacterium]